MSYFNTKKRLNTLVVVLLVVNVFSITALWLSNREDRHGPPDRPPANAEKFLQEALDLTSDQMEVIKTLREEHFREMQALVRANEESRIKMFEEVKAIKPDTVLLVKYAGQIGSTRAAIEELTTKHFLAIKSELRPDQVSRFNQTIEKLIPGPRGPGRGRPGGPPPGRHRGPGGHGDPGGPPPGRP
jgi:Spy/CpxP family protein refolding chaperone